MSLSDGAKEIVQRHCDGQPGLVEKVTAELEKENVLQVMMLSNLTDAQVETLVTGIATDELKDKKIMVGCALRSCVKDAGFQVDLFAAGQKALPLARNEKDWAAQMRRRAELLKSMVGIDHIASELMPPVLIWKRLTDNPSVFIDFKDLVESKAKKDTTKLGRSDPVKLDFILNDVPQSLTLPREEKGVIGGALWSQCYSRFCLGVMLATVTEDKVKEKRLDIDWFTLQAYGFRIAQAASTYGWETALDIDEAFRRFVETAYSEAHVRLVDCYNNSNKFAQLKVDAQLKSVRPGQPRAISSSSSSTTRSNMKSEKKTDRRKRKRGICYGFLEGRCEYGDACQFSHEKRRREGESRSSTKDRVKKDAQGPVDGAYCEANRERADSIEVKTGRAIDNPKAACLGLAREGLRKCAAAAVGESASLVDGTGADTSVYADSDLIPSTKVERLGASLKEAIDEISASQIGTALDEWISLGRKRQAESDCLEKLKPALLAAAEKIRRNWATTLGVSERKAAAGGNIRIPLMQAILEAMQSETSEPLDVAYMSLMDRGVPFGTTSDIPISGCWPTKEKPSPHGWYPVTREVWTNYVSAETFSQEVESTIQKEIELGRMVPIAPEDEGRIKATTRLACVPSYGEDGVLKKVRLVDDLRRNGVNSVIDPHIHETLRLPNAKSAVVLAELCLKRARTGGDASPLLWVESDIRGAFRLVRLDEQDTWWTTNTVNGKRYRHKVLPFGGESSPLLFVRFSSSLTKIASRMLRCCGAFDRAMVYIDDRGCPTTLKMARTTVLVLLLTDFILDVDVALDKFFCSSGPKVLGFELDLPRLRVVLPVEKRALIIESLTELSRKASTAPVQLVEKTLGRLVWASSIFHRLRSQLRPFFGVIKAIEPKSKERGAVKRRRVRRIRIGSSLAEAASYIKGILDNVTASPFPGLVPSLGEERAVIMCDASTKAAGGAIVSEDGRKIEWYHMDFTCAEVQAIIADYIPSFRVGDRPESGHMCFLELLSAVVGILSRPEDQMVLVMCDNSAAVNALCKLYAKSAALNKLMRLLTMSRPSLTTPLMKAIHVEGVSNVVADTISRAGYTVTRNMWSGFDDVKELRIDKILRSIRQPIAAKWL